MEEILVIEDDKALNAGLCENLQREGYAPFPSYTIKHAGDLIKDKNFDLILLDVNLPDGDGFTFAEKLRSKSEAPIFFLTARDLDEEVMRGFDIGADDYMTKPFNVKILLRRIHAVLVRCQNAGQNHKLYSCGNLEIDLDGYLVKKKGMELQLTSTEIKLLFKLCQNPGIVLTRNSLLEEIWDAQGNFVDEHALTVQISRLKSKIRDEEYSYIKTVYGMGYQWIGDKNE